MQYLLLLVLLFNFLLVAGPASATSLEFDRAYWLKLLHYQNGKSRADGENFFLSPNGKTNPDNELKATIEAFKNRTGQAGWFKYHPQCVFRERLRFLRSQKLLEGVEEAPCPMFEEWKAGLNAESMSLIFSSSYPNNPSSLFGHTLLRFNQKNKTNDLLDYAVAFSAIPEKDDLGLVFAAKGIFGGYKGLFEVTKYYTKVNEYNNGESRDLIEYDLKMDQEELDRMINHLWELYQTTYFDYYFADENCSAVLIDALAVPFHGEGPINIHDRWYYLPSEMVKRFKNIQGRISGVKYRPSLKKQLAAKWSGLSSTEVWEVKAIIDEQSLPKNYANAKVLDTVIGHLNFAHNRSKEKLSSEEQALLRSALIKRATLPAATEEKSNYDENNRPDLGHEPQKWALFLRTENRHALWGLELKQGYHDLMSNDQGFDSFSQFDFLTASLVYDFKTRKVDYDQLTLVDLVSFHEYRFYDPQLSWKAKVSSDRLYQGGCELCHKINANAYGGPTFKLDNASLFSPMLGVFAEAGRHLEKGHRLGVAAELSFYGQLGPTYKMGLINELRLDARKKMRDDFVNQVTLRHSFFKNTQWDVRLDSKVVSREGSFSKNTVIHQVSYGRFF